MKLEIISKIEEVIKKNINNELQVVYILTRIGKTLELENNEDSYSVLKFYRDWSVHTVLNRKKHHKVTGILKEFIEKKENRHIFSFHSQFCLELKSFLNKYGLPSLNKSKLNNFIFYLGKVISDTPIQVTVDGQQYCISVSEPVKKDWSSLYTISPFPCSPEG